MLAVPALAQLRIEITGTSDPRIRHSAQVAADDWARHLTSPVTVRIHVTTSDAMPINEYANASVAIAYRPYSAVREVFPALLESLPVILPRGFSLSSLVAIPSAQAKSIGLLAESNVVDGIVTLNNRLNWDDNDSDGVGIATLSRASVLRHEFGHLFGFLSSVDAVDYGPPSAVMPTIMDLSRFGVGFAPTTEQGWRDTPRMLDTEPALVSDGQTAYPMSSGVRTGNGFSASHREYGADSIMAPTLAYEQMRGITPDAVEILRWGGWQVAVNGDSPEPPSLLLLAPLLLALTGRVRSRTRADQRTGTRPPPPV